MDARADRKENSFDFRRGHSLPVIANAHIQPLTQPADNNEAQAPGLRRRLQSVLDRVLYQRLERERWY